MGSKHRIGTLKMEHIDCLYYINLDHRVDRRQEIESEVEREFLR